MLTHLLLRPLCHRLETLASLLLSRSIDVDDRALGGREQDVRQEAAQLLLVLCKRVNIWKKLSDRGFHPLLPQGPGQIFGSKAYEHVTQKRRPSCRLQATVMAVPAGFICAALKNDLRYASLIE